MSERTYTESELAAERAALLREAAAYCLNRAKQLSLYRKEYNPAEVKEIERLKFAETQLEIRSDEILAIPTDQSALARAEAAAVSKAFSKVQFQFNYWLHQGYDPLTAIQMSCDRYMDTLQDRGREAESGAPSDVQGKPEERR